jgi:1-deoxy-D-xylulose-5-phosphate synthase
MNSPTAQFPLLDTIDSPLQLRQLSLEQLPELAQQLRQFIIHSVSQTGGHLASGLGAVELTIALHYLYDTPNDRLVWDVGHQCYPHKILTGRKQMMSSLRQYGGLSGFPKTSESEYDHFGVGHSSTSIGAALGMAIAAEAQDIERNIVAIIGDGGMSAGMAFEALNHAGSIDTNLLVILNDNEMSISPNVGAMSKYLSRILSGSIYSHMRASSKKVLSQIPSAWELARRAEEHFKGMITPGTLFEEMGFSYFGPIDGHDLPNLMQLLSNLKKMEGPRLLHIVTKKGKGYEPAEGDSCKYHGTGPFDIATGAALVTSGDSNTQSYTQAFSDWVVYKGEQQKKLHVITPAMCEGSGLVAFSSSFPRRFHDVGIAEQHAVTLAAGMAIDGLKPVVAIYSTFLQRAYDQLIHDVAVQNLDVLFAVDRAGIVGADGATHTGNFDISFCRCIPDLIIMTPANTQDLHQLLNTGYEYPGPALVRYPRDNCEKLPQISDHAIPLGKAELLRSGKRLAILVFGPFIALAQELADKFDATLVNMRFVKPLDEKLLTQLAGDHSLFFCIEDNATPGGAGSAVAEFIMHNQLSVNCSINGLDDHFPAQGSRQQVLQDYEISLPALSEKITKLLVET